MPIQFPPPLRGNPFDRWQWIRGAKPPMQQPSILIAASRDGLAPCFPRPKSVATNLRQPNRMYRAEAPSYNNPAFSLGTARVYGGDGTIRQATRVFNSSRMVLSGQSQDGTGAPLANCQVMLFRTPDKAFVGETVSDGSGNWSFDILVGGPFFYVEYKAGSPDVAGTSKNDRSPTTLT